MAYYLDWSGTGQYTYAPTLGDIAAKNTFRIESDNYTPDGGYWFSQAGDAEFNRTIGIWSNSNLYFRGVNHSLGVTLSGTGNYAFEINISTGAFSVEKDGAVIASGTASGPNPSWLGQFRIGARANTDSTTDGSGAFTAGPNMTMGNHRVYLDGALVRNYVSDGTGSTWEESVAANDGTLVSFPTDDSQWGGTPTVTTQTTRKGSTFDIETILGTITTATLNSVNVFDHVTGQVGTTVSFAGAATDEITTSGGYSLVLGDGATTETITVQVNVVGVAPSNNPVQKDGAALANLTDVQVRVTSGANINGTELFYSGTATTDASGNLSNIDLSSTAAADTDPVLLHLRTAAGDSIIASETVGLI